MLALPASRRTLLPTMRIVDAFVDNLSDGEWAGWQCDFDVVTGANRPIDERYLPQAMIDWGQQQAGFELLSTERRDGDSLNRRFLRMLPEAGCAIESLTAEVSVSSIPLDALQARLQGGKDAWALDDPPGEVGPAWYLRTIFDTSDPQGPRRTRVSLRWDPSCGLGQPIRIAMERRWAAAGSLTQELHQGGASLVPGRICATGCSAEFVARAIAAPCFATTTRVPVPLPAESVEGRERALLMPGGVVVQATPSATGWTVEVGLSEQAGQAAPPQDLRDARSRRVVRRDFDAHGTLEAVYFL